MDTNSRRPLFSRRPCNTCEPVPLCPTTSIRRAQKPTRRCAFTQGILTQLWLLITLGSSPQAGNAGVRSRSEVAERAGRPPKVARINGWFLESQGQVNSRDSGRHIDWLLDRVAPRAEAVRSLQEMGCRMEISCYWLSRSGHGGPIIPPAQMSRLVELSIELSFDFYGPYEEDNA